jgi:hypothetical protein
MYSAGSSQARPWPRIEHDHVDDEVGRSTILDAIAAAIGLDVRMQARVSSRTQTTPVNGERIVPRRVSPADRQNPLAPCFCTMAGASSVLD